MEPTSAVPNEFSPGNKFAGKFVIERLLGQGGMGAVYSALHEGLRQRFAIKVLLGDVAQNAEAVQRFMNEASAAASIQSEHVARVTDVSRTESGMAYMVMEYLEGQDLAQLLEARGRLPAGEAVGYVLQAIEGVHQAHVAKIVHRDLKPSNLFLARKADGTQIIKVLDFGISKMTGLDAQAAALTSTRAMLGSPLYMSPEQLRNSKSVDGRSDVWSLGVILYELLTGQVPYGGDSLGELFACILENDPPSLRSIEPSIPPGLEAAVLQCLRKKREERFGSVVELAQALAPFANTQSVLLNNVTRGLVQAAGPWGDATGTGTYSGVASSGSLAIGNQQPMAQTGSGPSTWATGSMNQPAPSKAPIGLIAALSAAAALLVIVVLVVALKKRDTPITGEPPAPSQSAELTSAPTPSAEPSAAPSGSAEPVASTEPVASATPPEPVASTKPAGERVTTKPDKGKAGKEKPVPAPAPVAGPTPATKPSGKKGGEGFDIPAAR